MPEPVTSSQEIKVNGGFIVPRRVGLATLGSIIATCVTLLAYGVRAETRISALEKQTPAVRLRKMERVLCVLCSADNTTARQVACEAVCRD